MHEAVLTATSVRKDGKGFQAEIPGEGKQWLNLPDNLVGRVEWKKQYRVGWVKNPKGDRTYYDVRQLNQADPPSQAAPVAKVGNGNGEIDVRSIFGLMHTYNGNLPTIKQMVQDLRNAQAALEIFERGGSAEEFNDFPGDR